jgi:hypothetical protein
MADGAKFERILITAVDAKTLRALLRERPLDMSCGGPKVHENGAASVEAYVPAGTRDALRRPGIRIDVLEDASATAAQRQQEVGKGNRFRGDGQKAIPRGLGRKVKGGGGGGRGVP